MHKIRLNNIYKQLAFPILFAVIGALGLIAVTIGLVINPAIERSRMDSRTTATDIYWRMHNRDGDITYTPIFTYIVDGQEFTCTANSSFGFRDPTISRTVHYSSVNPSVCFLDATFPWWIHILAFSGPLIFLGIFAFQALPVSRQLKNIRHLERHGQLIRNLTYTTVDSNIARDQHGIDRIPRISVTYTLPNGTTINPISGPYFGGITHPTVDLVIDPNNLSCFHIDFNIESTSSNIIDAGGQPQTPHFSPPPIPEMQPLQNQPPNPTSPPFPVQNQNPPQPFPAPPNQPQNLQPFPHHQNERP
ncbi:hypothetical protein FWD07_02365 [Candidatus Saccharibacteria bacterium]|nr:hypothetical protein [Candidatus Saccharibacteria bacterium]